MVSKRSEQFYARTLRRLVPDAEHQQSSYFRLLRDFVRPGITWLDAGCGHTLVPEWMKGARELEESFLNAARAVVGCDADTASLSAHRKIRRVACNVEELCFREGVFDLVTCNVVAEHLEHPDRAFVEFLRVLKAGGRLVIHTPNLWHWATVASLLTPHWFHERAVKFLDGRETQDVFPTRYRANTARALRRKLRWAGFTDVMIHFVPGRPRLIGLGPLLYMECLAHRALRRFPQMAAFLCAVARKPERGNGTEARQCH